MTVLFYGNVFNSINSYILSLSSSKAFVSNLKFSHNLLLMSVLSKSVPLLSYHSASQMRSNLSSSDAEAELSVESLANHVWEAPNQVGRPFSPAESEAETCPVRSFSARWWPSSLGHLNTPSLPTDLIRHKKILLNSNYHSHGLHSPVH